jgi:ABC-type uncharacterized transport system substrate-binding protein
MRRVWGVAWVLALALLAAPLAAEAQSAAKMPRIGLLRPFLAGFPDPWADAFRQGLSGLGYIEGQNIAIEYRWADGKAERLPDLAADLVRLKVDIIVTNSTPAVRALKAATGTIPIVMAWASDPVGTGLIASLARPGGNLTGHTLSVGLEIYRQASPTAQGGFAEDLPRGGALEFDQPARGPCV